MKGFVVAALFAIATPAAAQTISKCPDGKGGHVYQDSPCTAGASVREWNGQAHVYSPQRQAQVERQMRIQQQAQAHLAQQARSANQSVVYSQSVPTSSQQRQSRCDAAKAWRKAQLDQMGLRRTYDDLRSLNEHVRTRCQ